MASQSTPALTATYASPTNETFKVTKKLPAIPPANSVTDKVSYLSALREAVTQTQQDINKELTARMEEDNARDAAKGTTTTANDEKDEENYGEEVQEDED